MFYQCILYHFIESVLGGVGYLCPSPIYQRTVIFPWKVMHSLGKGHTCTSSSDRGVIAEALYFARMGGDGVSLFDVINSLTL